MRIPFWIRNSKASNKPLGRLCDSCGFALLWTVSKDVQGRYIESVKLSSLTPVQIKWYTNRSCEQVCHLGAVHWLCVVVRYGCPESLVQSSCMASWQFWGCTQQALQGMRQFVQSWIALWSCRLSQVQMWLQGTWSSPELLSYLKVWFQSWTVVGVSTAPDKKVLAVLDR